MTKEQIARAFVVLETAGLRQPENMIASVAAADAAAELYADLLSDMTSEELSAAVRTHLRHPERGRFWPTPADLRGAAGVVQAALVDPDEAAWAYLRTARRGQSVDGRLDGVQRKALHGIGGVWAVSGAESDIARATLRRDFLGACKSLRSPPKLIEGGKRDALPDNVRRLLSPGSR